MTKLVIDTDPGIDDAHALLLAYAYPGAEIHALTTVAGNVTLERTTANALTILDLLHQDTPVYPGCEQALVIPTLRRAISHGQDGLGDCSFPPANRQASGEHATQALIRMANESPGELTLVALGPLTNIALATRLDPQLPKKFKRLVILGGAIHAIGNSWNAAAEFNFYVDPEAAAAVFHAWHHLLLVPWETVMKCALTRDQFETLAAIPSPRAAFFRQIFQRKFERQYQELGHWYNPDPLAMAVALEPAIITHTQQHFVQIELAGALTRGQTVVDWSDLYGRQPNTTLVMGVNQQHFFELLQLSLQ